MEAGQEASSSVLSLVDDSTCLLCEEQAGGLPYPCQHRLCEACLLRCQGERMYSCPFCRVKQKTAVPSLEYKLLKLLLGVEDEESRELLKVSLQAVVRCEEGATIHLDAAIAKSVPFMRDFPSKHFEAPDCLRMIQSIVSGCMTTAAARQLLMDGAQQPVVEEERRLT